LRTHLGNAPLSALVLVAAGLCGAAQAASRAADLQTVRKRYLELIAPSTLDPKRPEAKTVLARLDANAERLMKSQVMTGSAPLRGALGKVGNGKPGADGDSIGGQHFYQMPRLAKAYATRGTRLHRSPVLLKHIVAALEFCEPHVRPGSPRRGNWWAWDVGIPGALADTLILAGDGVPAPLRARLLKGLQSLVRTRYRSNYYGGGANVLYVALNQLRTAMLTGREDYARNAAAAYAAMSSTKGELGIQRDYSYHFHGHGLNMGYGRVQLSYVSRFIYLTAGTSFAMPPEARRTHEEWFRRFVVWNSYRGRVSPFTVARDISRGGSVERRTALEAAAFLYLAEDGSCRDLALSFVREWHDANPEASFATPSLAALQPRLEPAMKRAEPMPTGARYFPLSDYLTCRRKNFYAAVRMSSTRIKAWFSIRKENLHGGRSGDGTLVLMTDGSEWDNEVIPTMNWYALSGVTAGTGCVLPAERAGMSRTVGGLSHRGRWGLAGMDFAVRCGKGALRARKSYAVLDRGVVLMGSDVHLDRATLPKGKVPYTTLHQCPLRDEDRSFTVDGRAAALADGEKTLEVRSWLHVRNYGYWFPEPTRVTLRVNTSTRGYAYLNGRTSSRKTYTRRFFTLSVTHSGKPETSGYAVVILPGVKAAEMPGLAARPGVKVLARSKTVHALRDESAGLTACCFFARGEVAGFAADRPLVVAASTENGRRHLTIQDPAHKGGSVTLRVPFRVTGTKDVKTAPAGDGTRLTVPLSRGYPKTLF
jgi:hyaluronate lyase